MQVNPVRFAEALWNATLYAAKDGPTGANVCITTSQAGLQVIGFDGFAMVSTVVPLIGEEISFWSVVSANDMKKLERELRDSKDETYEIAREIFPSYECPEGDIWEDLTGLHRTSDVMLAGAWAVNPSRLANLGRLKSGGEDPIDLRLVELDVGGHAWEFLMGENVRGFVSILDRDLLKESGKKTW